MAKKIMVTCERCFVYQEADSYCIGCGAPLPTPEKEVPTTPPPSTSPHTPPMPGPRVTNSTTAPILVYDEWYDPALWRRNKT